MHPRSALIAVALVIVTLQVSPLAAGQATAKPKPVPALPAAIETAFKTAYPKATIKAVHKEKYGGKDAYEIESLDGGKTRDIVYHLDGTVAVVEEEIAAADLPAPVLAAIKKDYPKATITRYERSMESGATSYEVQLKGVKDKSAEYTPDGKRK